MSSARALAPLLVLLVLTACSGSEPTADAGPGTDAGDTDAGADAGLVLHNTLPSGFNASPGQRSDRTEF
jgi:hypothetical protein